MWIIPLHRGNSRIPCPVYQFRPNDLISGAAFCVRLICLFGLLAEAMFLQLRLRVGPRYLADMQGFSLQE